MWSVWAPELLHIAVPKKPPRPCPVAGCPELIYDGGECPRHPRQRRERARPSAASRGYGRAWQIKRDAWAKTHPYCADPFGFHHGQLVPMKIVDHIQPRKLGGKDDESNYQSLCGACHNYKTAHDGSRRRGRAV